MPLVPFNPFNQSGPGSNGNEGVPRIHQSPSITGTSPSDCLLGVVTPLQRCNQYVLQPQPTGPQDIRSGKSCPSAEVQSVYSTALADWGTGDSFGRVLPLCRGAVNLFYSPSRLGHRRFVRGSLTPLQRCCQFILQP